ncbi:hypothetical protein EDD22DRAFT_855552 [Suillus occidentalis]|nr:hypothetical protein EDD22DRAFT_855552 [Suillus occidentalis]
MVTSCGALHCSWEKDTDFRGLDRHRSTCKYYQRESTLAAQKRRDRARESVEKSTQQPHRQAIITGSAAHNGLGPIRFAKNRSMKPIARCEPRACAQRPVQVGPSNLNNPINTISESGPGISTFDSAPVFHGSDTSDGDSGPSGWCAD